MQRTKLNNLQQTQELVSRLENLSELTQRIQLAYKAGKSYDDNRDIYQALGYDSILTYQNYYSQYKRQDVAKAVIDRPVKATWRGKFGIIEAGDDQDTKFEKAWSELDDILHFKTKFTRLDRLTGIGKYGVLLLGLDDVKSRDDYSNPVTGDKRKLLYLMPFSSDAAKIDQWEKQPDNPRYGQPLIYRITVTNAEGTDDMEIRVHHSRVIHIVDDPLENEVEGTPRLQAIYNRLKDAEKVVGGSAEMFWRGARPGYQGKIDPDFSMSDTQIEALKTQIDEYENNLRRILTAEGLELKSLAMQVADPKGHVDVIIQMISMVTGIPKRILTGSERGELASSQDRDEWNTWIKARREDFAEFAIVRPFVDRCIKYGILPKPVTGEYSVEWEDLFAPSEKEKAEVGKTRAAALKEYVSQPADHIITPEAFMQYFLGLNEDQIEHIQEMLDAVQSQEPELTEEERQIMEEEQRRQEEINNGDE